VVHTYFKHPKSKSLSAHGLILLTHLSCTAFLWYIWYFKRPHSKSLTLSLPKPGTERVIAFSQLAVKGLSACAGPNLTENVTHFIGHFEVAMVEDDEQVEFIISRALEDD
jgi:hypothetical protein